MVVALIAWILVPVPHTRAEVTDYSYIPDGGDYSPHNVGHGPWKVNYPASAMDWRGFEGDYALFGYASLPTTAELAVKDFVPPPVFWEGWNDTHVNMQIVWAVAVVGEYGYPGPGYDDWTFRLKYSTNGGESFNSTGNFGWASFYMPVIFSGRDARIWNITTLEAWTPEMLTSPDTMVQFEADMPANEFLWVDYIGFYWKWNLTAGGGAGGNQTVPNRWQGSGQGLFDWASWDFISGGTITGIMGLVGIGGMVIGPAAMAMAVKKGSTEHKFKQFIGALAMFMISFSLFMVAIGGW